MAVLVCFHAHPDDESIATAGTMYKAAEEGHDVVLVLATRGELGLLPEDLNEGETLGMRREAETRKSAEILGASKVYFLDYADSGMADGDPEELKRNDSGFPHFADADLGEASNRLAKILNEVSADVLTMYDPDGGYKHPDHIQVHRVGTLAAEKAGVSKIYWATMNRDQIRKHIWDSEELQDAMGDLVEGEEVLDEERRERAAEEDFGMAEADITHAIDTTPYLKIKRESMKAHKSQITPDSFFMTMTDESFSRAFGTEWFSAPWHTRGDGDFIADLF